MVYRASSIAEVHHDKVKEGNERVLRKVLIDLESELGTRLDYDDVIRLLVAKVTQRPPATTVPIPKPS